jgi:hypothetical protein
VHVEAVLEVMRSGGSAVALGEERDDGGGEERRRYIGEPIVLGEATA